MTHFAIADPLDKSVKLHDRVGVSGELSFLAPEADCPACLMATGRLCFRHERYVLPQLAKNLGWLRLMGEALVEQVARQTAPPKLTAKERYAVARVARREARKAAKRGNGAIRLAKALTD